MVLHRNSHRDERRRRVLLEETGLDEPELRDADQGGLPRGGGNATKPYSDSALAIHQPRVVDLIPVRLWSLTVLALLVTSAVVGLEALYGYLAQYSVTVALRQVPAFDLAAPGNLAHWFAGGMLLLAAGWGCLIYLMRRHRTDDYRGRYRLWYWVVPLLVLASVNQSADFGTSLRVFVLAAAGIPDYPNASLIWAAIATVLATSVAARLVIEMGASRVAVMFAVIAWASAGFVQAMQLDWVLDGVGTFQVMVESGMRMVACGTLFMSLCLYARHVYQEAHGKLPAKTKRKESATPKPRMRRKAAEVDAPDRNISNRNVPASTAKTESAKAEPSRLDSAKPSKTAESVPGAGAAQATTSAAASNANRPAGMKLRVDAPHATPGSPETKSAKSVTAPKTTAPSMPVDIGKRRVSAPAVAEKSPAAATVHQAPDAGDDEDDGDSSLSRSERRRLKKLQRRERRPG